MTEGKQDAAMLHALYAKIEEILRQFREIREEAEGIVENSAMPDAALHLNDVLQHTEEATTTILDAATTIGSLTDNAGVAEQIGRIYEACSFQDISGQRIKKVLGHINTLETQLSSLAESVRGSSGDTASKKTKAAAPQKTGDAALMNGPALAADAPSQAEVDAMFKSM